MDTRMNIGTRLPIAQPETDTNTVSIKSDSNLDSMKSTSAEETEKPAVLTKAGASSLVAEFALSGRAKAAELSSMLPPIGAGASGPSQVTEPLLKNGSQGPEVQEMQQQLNIWRTQNGKEPISEDGIFGNNTEAALREFQAATGLSADGIAGPNTKDRLALESNANFQQLPAETQNQVRNLMSQYDNKPTVRKEQRPERDPREEPIGGGNTPQDKQMAKDHLHQLATDPNFGKLPRETQDALLKKLSVKPESIAIASHVQDLAREHAKMETSDSFQKLDPAMKKQFRDLMMQHSDDPSAREGIVNLATTKNFPQLSKANQDSALRSFQKNPNTTNSNELTRIIDSPGFQQMDEATRTRTLTMFETHASDAQYTNKLATMVANNKFPSLSPADKQKMLSVFDNSSPEGRDALDGLLRKTVDGKPALQKTDSTGTTLLDNLNKLATTPLDPRVKDANGNAQDKAQVLGDLLQEVNEPDQNIDQKNRGTCGATVPQTILAEKNPSEYARLITELSTKGQAKLANGDTMEPPSDGFREDGSGRSVGERMMQSALMNYGRPDGNYRNNHQSGIPDGTVPGGLRHDGYSSGQSGLPAFGQQKVMEGLFGGKFENRTRDKNSDGSEFMKQIQEDLKKGKGPIPAGVMWGKGGHAVEIEKIENGRVYFRNPWGQSVGQNGASTLSGPPRQVVDSLNGKESMSVEDFQKIINEVTVAR